MGRTAPTDQFKRFVQDGELREKIGNKEQCSTVRQSSTRVLKQPESEINHPTPFSNNFCNTRRHPFTPTYNVCHGDQFQVRQNFK
jgi:hypothetical protein